MKMKARDFDKKFDEGADISKHLDIKKARRPITKRKERKSLLSLGGIAKGRKIGVGNEREYAKKAVARKIARECL